MAAKYLVDSNLTYRGPAPAPAERAGGDREIAREQVINVAQQQRLMREGKAKEEEAAVKAELAKNEAIEARDLQRQANISVERARKEQTEQAAAIGKQKAVEAAQVDKERTIAAAEVDKQITLTLKAKEAAEADAQKAAALALKEKADQEVTTVGKVAEAERMKQVAIVAAQREAEQEKIAAEGPHVTPVIGFGGNVRAGINVLATRRPRDPSTNLNGAVVEGVKTLNHQMDLAPVPLRFGTLVVFTDGTDRARRVAPEEVTRALDGAGFDTYVIGVGQEVDRNQLARIGRTGTFASKNREDIVRGFDDIAARIEAKSKRYYLLSYCSPSRAGQHQVEIEAVTKAASGRLSYDFNAQGFGPNCDPNQKPAFDVHHPRSPPAHAAGGAPGPRAGSSEAPPSSSSPGWTPKR